ncbi:NAD+ kinase [Evansella vedderi]|uniref:NAD kinase n=1 Tax=Evansella vedderi TaxID=38282 RepID=A0ABT9ZVM1_9BACI|nr:NAD kinase [Evansella vedderi]MDQ0254787.1 NAD+ kinase [Evansella vedderi]
MITSFQIVDRGDKESQEMAEKFRATLTDHGFSLSNNPDLVISIGGDGTMLRCFRDYYSPSTAFVGLHTGTLGFYADWSKEEAGLLLHEIQYGKPHFEKCPLIQGTFELLTGEKKTFLSLNEIIIKSNSISTLVLDVKINGEKFESFRGDGILVSTPSGSTAYNHSLMGSIMHPTLDAMQVTEMASINNSVYRTLNRSFILPKEQHLILEFPTIDERAIVGIDGEEYHLKQIKSIHVCVADNKINFARYKPFPFWERVKGKFLKEM